MTSKYRKALERLVENTPETVCTETEWIEYECVVCGKHQRYKTKIEHEPDCALVAAKKLLEAS